MTLPGDVVIELEAVGFRHVAADRPALDRVSISIRAGEYVGLLGATGAGVSTLLLSLDGVVPQLVRGEASGAVSVLGRDPRVVPVPAWAGDIGLVLDDPSVASTQATVADEVAFGLENLGAPTATMGLRIATALESVGLAGFEERAPATLSGGELQRLAIACALVTGPRILVLDEPTANLDPTGRRAVYRVLRRLNRAQGVTVLVSDQDAESIASDATRVVALGAGRVVADGPPASVLGDPTALARHGIRPTGAASVAAAVGVGTPVPVTVEAAARVLARRSPAHRPPVDGVAGAAERLAELASASALPAEAAADGGPALVLVRDVAFRYPGATGQAVAGVTLSVMAGEVVGVAGANGSGKTTLGRLVNGLLRPSSGRISVDGMDTASHPVRMLAAHVGSVFQEPAHQLLATTVAEELALGPRALGVSEARIGERVRALAEALELDDVLGRHPLRLGRAERKLVALGAVLAMAPRVLVLDEPTTGADVRLAGIVEAQVLAAAARGCAVLVPSHDMAFLGRVATRIVVMGGGRVVADAPTRAVFADARLLAVAGLEPPAAARVALAVAPSGPSPWPPVSLEEAARVLRRAGPDDGPGGPPGSAAAESAW